VQAVPDREAAAGGGPHVATRSWPWIAVGLAAIVMAFGGVGGWGATVPLASAVVATGQSARTDLISETASWAGRFFDQVWGTPVDCLVHHSIRLADSVGTLRCRGEVLSCPHRCWGTIGLLLAQHCPGCANEFVGKGDDRDIGMPSRLERVEPLPEVVVVTIKTGDDRARTVDEQTPQVGIATLTDAKQALPAAGRVLPWNEPEPRC
jgi:hypothetical protein